MGKLVKDGEELQRWGPVEVSCCRHLLLPQPGDEILGRGILPTMCFVSSGYIPTLAEKYRDRKALG